MTDQSIEHAADRAVSSAADPGEAQGAQAPGAHERMARGGTDEEAARVAETGSQGEQGAADAADADTEGARYAQEVRQRADEGGA